MFSIHEFVLKQVCSFLVHFQYNPFLVKQCSIKIPKKGLFAFKNITLFDQFQP